MINSIFGLLIVAVIGLVLVGAIVAAVVVASGAGGRNDGKP